MGSRQFVADDDASTEVDLSGAVQNFDERWRGQPLPTDLNSLSSRLGFRTYGLKALFEQYDCQGFFPETLPFIVALAGQLPQLLPSLRLKRLVQGVRDRLLLPRTLVASLMAHMFLCTIPEEDRSQAMPSVSFDRLLGCRSPEEVAKLCMFLHYFQRLREEQPRGELRMYRQVRERASEEEQKEAWTKSRRPLLEIEAVAMNLGFEDVEKGEGCLLADFANMFIGGGVLRGGCVQEEIRFAICPELCVAMLVCPCMLPNEAITVVGGEQFSAYRGYGRGLRFGGPFRHPSLPTDADGTPLVAITAMDALDLRGADSSIGKQMSLALELRELEKAAAAFEPVDEAALRTWPIVATGNWGCGAFLGCAPLKAVLQWLAASQGGRRLRYFPFDLALGPELAALSQELSASGVTVGQLFQALRSLSYARVPPRGPEVLQALRASLQKVLAEGRSSKPRSKARA